MAAANMARDRLEIRPHMAAAAPKKKPKPGTNEPPARTNSGQARFVLSTTASSAGLRAALGSLTSEVIRFHDGTLAGIVRWPQDYQYELAPDGQTYTLFAVGVDGKPGTADDLYPDLPDSVARHSGYRARR